MIDLFIIAGFLGAGKTTFIEKWLAESEDSGLTVVIENDFGDVNMDAAYLANRNIEVKSLSSGCICCSLSKDFESAIRDIALRWQPSRIIVEPSGVAHLSDIEKACLPLIKEGLIQLKEKITLVDVSMYLLYAENFGGFYTDQVQGASKVFLSHMPTDQELFKTTLDALKRLNAKALISDENFNTLDLSPLLENRLPVNRLEANKSSILPLPRKLRVQPHRLRRATQVPHFESLTLSIHQPLSDSIIQVLGSELQKGTYGQIYRAKGFIPVLSKTLALQYTPQQLHLTPSVDMPHFITFIGFQLQDTALKNLLKGAYLQ